MKLQPVRTAVIGCGMISQIYLKNMIERFAILDVVGCAAAHPESAHARAEEFGIRAMTVDEILADESIELVVNLTPPTAHYDIVRRALEAGKHIYTEKILATELWQARELVRLADERGLYLGVAPDTFLGAGIQTARFALDSGMIGEPTGVAAVLNRDNGIGAEFIPFIAKRGGGIGFDVGIYYMTAISYLLGPVARCCGFCRTRTPRRVHNLPSRPDFGSEFEMESETLFSAALEFANGASGTLQFNGECVMEPTTLLTVYGTQGILYLPDPNTFGGEVRVLRRGEREPTLVPPNHGFADNSRGLGVAELAWSLRQGRAPRASKEMALHALEVLFGVAESGASGQIYSVQSSFTPTPPLPQGYLRETRFADFRADEEAALI